MPTYKRNNFLNDKNHPTFLLAKLEIVDKLIIVWHNIGETIPESILKNIKDLNIDQKIVFKFPEKNTLNNRFYPYEDIKTNCVMSIDDDYLCTENALIKSYNTWMNNPDLLVGIVPRYMAIINNKNVYTGEASGVNNYHYNMLLTGGAIFHKKYLTKYYREKDNLELIDNIMNGEDIVFNFIYNFNNKKAQLIYIHDKNVKTWKRIKGNAISNSGNHMQKRFFIYKKMIEKYGNILSNYNQKIYV